MSEILLLNPSKKRAKKKTTRKRRPAKRKANPRRRTTKTAARKKPVARRVTKKGAYSMAKKRSTKKRRAPRRNPRARRAGKAVSRRASSSLAGLNFKGALKNVPIHTIGMFAAKWAAKRFGEAATETDPNSWNYASYLKGAAGAAVAGFLANMLKRGTGQKVLEGGLSLMMYKLVQNELVPNSQWATGQFGAAAEDRYPGVIEENDQGEPFILGEDNQWYPLEGADDFRMEPGYELYGDALVAPGPLGDALVAPGPLGETDELDELYNRSFINR